VPHSEFDNQPQDAELDFLPLREGDHICGSDDALVTLMEFGDYECEGCGIAYGIIRQMEQEFGDKLRFVFRHYPYARLHPHAELAAQAAEAAAAQGKFWEMHDILFKHQHALERENLLSYADQLNLDSGRFAEELDAETYLDHVRSDFRSGVQNGVFGTPTLFLNGIRHNTEISPEILRDAIQRAMPEALTSASGV
jgi:formate-nitrite transporter family protein